MSPKGSPSFDVLCRVGSCSEVKQVPNDAPGLRSHTGSTWDQATRLLHQASSRQVTAPPSHGAQAGAGGPLPVSGGTGAWSPAAAPQHRGHRWQRLTAACAARHRNGPGHAAAPPPQKVKNY
ncbi:hypothetical protein NDU88_002252 [Pleurodeles waltl]|uniref:Uncharacterized protein n=1 Tax=Pleurodeles waltl TaxID=8319 RepID=A0AAV7TL86_PLEWA|nr:hypothetical protein NDU88_002252 [Pleurodeles waltl]